LSNIAEAAKRLISENGSKAVLRIPQGSPVYNPETNEYDSPEVSYNGYAMITNYDETLIDGTVIRADDLKVKAVLDGKPEAGTSKLDIYNTENIKVETLSIINVLPVKPNASLTILYNLQCRA
jgi:hypothetical protein